MEEVVHHSMHLAPSFCSTWFCIIVLCEGCQLWPSLIIQFIYSHITNAINLRSWLLHHTRVEAGWINQWMPQIIWNKGCRQPLLHGSTPERMWISTILCPSIKLIQKAFLWQHEVSVKYDDASLMFHEVLVIAVLLYLHSSFCLLYLHTKGWKITVYPQFWKCQVPLGECGDKKSEAEGRVSIECWEMLQVGKKGQNIQFLHRCTVKTVM